MHKRRLFMLVIPAAALLTVAQTFPPFSGDVKQGPKKSGERENAEGIMCQFYVQGREYRGALPATQVKSAPSWNSSSPLPFSLARAEKKARIELAKFVSDADRWQVSQFQVTRFRFADENAWYMSVTFEPVQMTFSDSLPPDSFTVFLDFDGKPGRISCVDQAK